MILRVSGILPKSGTIWISTENISQYMNVFTEKRQKLRIKHNIKWNTWHRAEMEDDF